MDRAEFRKNQNIDRKDFATIEYLLRNGSRKVEMYESNGIRNLIR